MLYDSTESKEKIPVGYMGIQQGTFVKTGLNLRTIFQIIRTEHNYEKSDICFTTISVFSDLPASPTGSCQPGYRASAILIDAATGKILFNSHDKHFPASTTKIMTILTLKAQLTDKLVIDARPLSRRAAVYIY